MSGPVYHSIADWREEPEWRCSTVRHEFRRYVSAKLGDGVTCCDSIDDLMKKLNVEHIAEPQVYVRGIGCSSQGIDRAVRSPYPVLRLSKHSLCRLIHETKGLRLERRSNYDVEHSGAPRLMLVISTRW